MIRQNSELTRLLAAAIGLVHAREDDAGETVRIGEARYRLSAEHHDGTGWVVVLVQVAASDRICDEQLRSCYGLTNREIEVARLLAERKSNREIAQLLDFTIYTAGRHTENILRKLRVPSRKDVRSKLMGAN